MVSNNETVIDQADFFMPDGFTRVTGLPINQLASLVFFNNASQPWPLVNGSTILDNLVASGHLYFHEIQGNPGYYSVRFRPNAVGFWRVVLTYTVGTQIVALDFDIVSAPLVDVGLNASFIRPGC